MVFYFKVKLRSEYDNFGSNEPDYLIYMGRDKVENDPLIKHSHKKNIWFHVDNYSSAHLYVQLNELQQSTRFEDLKLEDDLLEQVAQLTKANSIKANKVNNITVIYTPVENLHTDGSMDIGTVTFKNPKKVKRVHVVKKENAIVNKLNKTKYEISTEEFIQNQEKERREHISNQKQMAREAKKEQLLYQQQKDKGKDPYADLFTQENMKCNSNEFKNENWVEDEFW